jgi:hypothetical protein
MCGNNVSMTVGRCTKDGGEEDDDDVELLRLFPSA